MRRSATAAALLWLALNTAPTVARAATPPHRVESRAPAALPAAAPAEEALVQRPPPPTGGIDLRSLEFPMLVGGFVLMIALLLWQQLQIARVGSVPAGFSRARGRGRETLAEMVAGLDERVAGLERSAEDARRESLRPAIPEPRHYVPMGAQDRGIQPRIVSDERTAPAPVVQRPDPPQQNSGPSLTELESEFRSASSPPSRQRIKAFMRDRAAFGLRLAPGEILAPTAADDDPLLIGVAVGAGRIAVLPGADVVVNFATTYSSLRNMPVEVSTAFDFDTDGSRQFKLTGASLWAEERGGYRLLRRGLIGGLND